MPRKRPKALLGLMTTAPLRALGGCSTGSTTLRRGSFANMGSAPDLVRTVRRVKALRKVGWPVYKYYRATTASGIARPIFINSIPKAGTHLLASVLSKVDRINFSGVFIALDFMSPIIAEREGEVPDYDRLKLLREVKKVRPGTFANCHLYYDEYTHNLLTSPETSAVFIVRDPRDIIVSQLHYIEQFHGHHFHGHLTSAYKTQAERLDALIFGWEPDGPVAGTSDLPIRGMADIGTRLRSFQGWSTTLPTFKFEEFASAPDRESLDNSLQRLLQAVGLEEICDIEAARQGIGDKWSATFNKAAAGGWRDVLSEHQAVAVVDLAGDYLAEFGYPLD